MQTTTRRLSQVNALYRLRYLPRSPFPPPSRYRFARLKENQMTPELSAAHSATYDMIFQHPISRNLEWRHVRAMLTAMSDSVEEHTENVKFTRNGQTLVVHPPRRKDFSDVQELMNIRHFLERSAAPVAAPAPDGSHLLVVIDHRMARVYKTEMHGAEPQRIMPNDRDGSSRYLHYVEDDPTGQRKPEQRGFYDAVAKSLSSAESILIFGSGTGASSAMDQLLAELRERYKGIAKHVVRTVVVNEQHLTEDQLLAKARETYAELALVK
jgi:hypothetical protein